MAKKAKTPEKSMLLRAAWATVTLRHFIHTGDGDQSTGLYGYIHMVTDKEWGEGFRSSERWQLLVYDHECAIGDALPRVVIPGCEVSAIVVGEKARVGANIFDTREEFD